MATIDNPPAQPTAETYEAIALNIYPVATSSDTWNVSKQRKTWFRKLQDGENPKAFRTFSFYDNTGVFHQDEMGMTLGEAAAVNLAPAGTMPPPGTTDSYWVDPIMPSPARPLIDGEIIVGEIGGFLVKNTRFVAAPEPQTQAQLDETAEIERIGEEVEELLAAEKLPIPPK